MTTQSIGPFPGGTVMLQVVTPFTSGSFTGPLQGQIGHYLIVSQLVGGKSVIDVGCGQGQGAYHLARSGAASVQAVEADGDALSFAREHHAHPRLDFMSGDAGTFATDRPGDVLLHFSPIRDAKRSGPIIANLRRAVTSDGMMILSLPPSDKQGRSAPLLASIKAAVAEHFAGFRLYRESPETIGQGAGETLFRTWVEWTEISGEDEQPDHLVMPGHLLMIAMASDASGTAALNPVLAVDAATYSALTNDSDEGLPDKWAARQMLEERLHSADAEIARLSSENAALCARLPQLTARAQEAEARASQILPLQSALDARDGNIQRLTETHRQETQDLKQDHVERVRQLRSEHVGAVVRYQDLLRERGALVARVEKAEETLARETELMLSQIQTLRSEGELRMGEIERLAGECASLKTQLSSLSTRTSDAESRRLEAYEFARISSDMLYGLRRELDMLKRDVAEALDTPERSLSVTADHRHRDIVESMARLFPGTEATKYLARDPIVERIARLALEVHQLRCGMTAGEAETGTERLPVRAPEDMQSRFQVQIDALRREAEAQRERADRAEAFASEWHEQIVRLRRTLSWRLTAPLRAFGRLFR